MIVVTMQLPSPSDHSPVSGNFHQNGAVVLDKAKIYSILEENLGAKPVTGFAPFFRPGADFLKGDFS